MENELLDAQACLNKAIDALDRAKTFTLSTEEEEAIQEQLDEVGNVESTVAGLWGEIIEARENA